MIGADTTKLWSQIGGIHTSLINSGVSVGFSVYVEQLAHCLKVGLIKISFCPKVPADGTGDDVIVSELRLSGDLDAFRAAVKAAVVDS
jgi:hypothetical protein